MEQPVFRRVVSGSEGKKKNGERSKVKTGLAGRDPARDKALKAEEERDTLLARIGAYFVFSVR